MEPVYGIHLGLVVSSSPDPEGRNRVQVWVPHISNTLYKSINSKLNESSFNNGEDLNIKDPSDLDKLDSNIVKTLHSTLPWAEYAAPLFGGSSGLYNSENKATATNSGSTLQTEPNPKPSGYNPYPFDMNSTAVKPDTNIFDVARTRQDIPYDGRPATIRYNNPGGAYPKATFVKFGMTGYGVIGGGNPIGNYPSVANGAAANMYQLRTMPVVGMTVGEARNYWVTGNKGGFMDLPGMDSNQVITTQLLEDQNWLAGWMKSTAVAEGFGKISDQDLTNAFSILDGQSQYDPSNIVYNKNPIQIPNRTAGTGYTSGNVGVAGSAVGSFTTPNAGSKVWVFFLGGDVQRPVYFAQAPNPGDVKAS